MTRREHTTGTERGVALVMALLVVAMAALITTAAFRELGITVKREQNLTANSQGMQYARGLESWAMAGLARDYREKPGFDSRTEPWAQALGVLPIDNGRLTGRLTDLDGRFNLNNLVVNGERQPEQMKILRRLLTVLGEDPRLTEALADWQDTDVHADQWGAEDGTYMRANPPYRSANRGFSHVSELRLIAGIDEEVYRRITPFVATLPVFARTTPININTASVPVLRALDDRITQAMADELYRDGEAAFPSADAFTRHARLKPLQLEQTLLPHISAESRHFIADGLVEFAGVTQTFHSLLIRNGETTRPLWRVRGSFALQ